MRRITIISVGEQERSVAVRAMEMLKGFQQSAEHICLLPGDALHQAASIHQLLEKKETGVVIVTAGVMTSLPSLIAANTTIPVIAVPVKTPLLNGLDTLMSVVRVPVGCASPAVAIDGGENAALLALQILAVHDKVLAAQLAAYRESMKEHVVRQNIRLKEEHPQ